MRTLTLSNCERAFIDDQDFWLCIPYTWHKKKAKNNIYYAKAIINNKHVYLHRFIGNLMGLIGSIDHEDRNGLNCHMNATIRKDNSTGYKGVYKHSVNPGYYAQIWINGKCIGLGSFQTLESAIEARRKATILYHGKYGREK